MLIDDRKLKAWADAIALESKVDKQLNNPGGLLWLNQHGSLPAEPLILGRNRPMAKFDTYDNGLAALQRHLSDLIATASNTDLAVCLSPTYSLHDAYRSALSRIASGASSGTFGQFFSPAPVETPLTASQGE